MPASFEYTTLAQRYTGKFPVITYVGTQVNFWIVANLTLMVILRLFSAMMAEAFDVPVVGNFATTVWIGIALGVLYGTGHGLTGYYLDKRLFRTLNGATVIVYKTLISIGLFALILMVFRLVFFERFISPSLSIAGVQLNEKSWDNLFYLFLIYYFMMTLIISFINQVNKKYGPGVLLPLLLGKYRTPKEEERIFMFMDLQSSTSTAERLGHLKYSAFIQDCFADINEILFPFHAQVYQYVGDEIIIMWPPSEGLKEARCLKFYFAVKTRFETRKHHYLSKYGLIPVFKAGMHMGKVTVVEIGEIKKDIAYHGDTLNTAARIQAVCNQFGHTFIVSKYLLDNVIITDRIVAEPLGAVELKGKAEKVELVSIEIVNN